MYKEINTNSSSKSGSTFNTDVKVFEEKMKENSKRANLHN
jgi:hypothetical protein